jgi:hypothetical protein
MAGNGNENVFSKGIRDSKACLDHSSTWQKVVNFNFNFLASDQNHSPV